MAVQQIVSSAAMGGSQVVSVATTMVAERASPTFLITLMLLLVSCGGGDEGSNNHGYGFQYDVQGASGLKLRGESDPSLYEKHFAEVEACTGLSATPPFVIVQKLESLDGQYLSGPSLVLIDPSIVLVDKHEFIHYLLDVNTGDLDPNHKSDFFRICA